MDHNMCPHLLLGGLNQPLVAAMVDDKFSYLCADCAVTHIIEALIVHKMLLPEITEMVTFEKCEHLTRNKCGVCYSAIAAKLLFAGMDAKLKGSSNMYHRVRKLLNLWHDIYGAPNPNRIKLC
jgi:hypothetical protein